jgi:hypothetical protein
MWGLEVRKKVGVLKLQNKLLAQFKWQKMAGCQWLVPIILAMWVNIRRIRIQGQPRQFVRAHFNQWLDVVAQACHLIYCMKHTWEDHSPGQPREKVRPPSPK